MTVQCTHWCIQVPTGWLGHRGCACCCSCASAGPKATEVWSARATATAAALDNTASAALGECITRCVVLNGGTVEVRPRRACCCIAVADDDLVVLLLVFCWLAHPASQRTAKQLLKGSSKCIYRCLVSHFGLAAAVQRGLDPWIAREADHSGMGRRAMRF